MKLARKILVKTLGLKGYLKIVSRTYIRMISKGKMRDQYAELYFVQKLLKEGDVAIDIGANLAYYSYFIAQQIGKKGKLIAVEPIPLFAEVWKQNMKAVISEDMKLYNCALGEEEKEKVKMSIPIVNGVVRHGLTKVEQENDGNENTAMSFEVPMKRGDDILAHHDLDKITYIKCDVEGYEQYVIPSFDKAISRFKPLLQIELGGAENRKNVADYLTEKGYEIYILEKDVLIPQQKNDIFSLSQDFYFIHADKKSEFQHLIGKK